MISNFAFASGCSQFYPNNKEIQIEGTRELCNSFYVIRYSDKEKGPVLTSNNLSCKHHDKVVRSNDFHTDDRIKNGPKPSDYSRTGFDKGHMTPAGDSSNSEEMHETFLMTNMTPQEPTVNRISWRELEESVRNLCSNSDSISVVTIAEYSEDPKRLSGGEAIPSGYWKVIQQGSKIRYFYADNVPHGLVKEVFDTSIQEILSKGEVK